MVQKRGHNKLFYQNSALIKAEYLRILKAERRMPSQLEVAKNLKLTQTTVSMHLNSVDFSELTEVYKLFTTDILNALMDKAKDGDVPAIKFFLFLTAGVTEEFKITSEHKENVKIDVTISPQIAKQVGDALAKDAEFEVIEEAPKKLLVKKTNDA